MDFVRKRIRVVGLLLAAGLWLAVTAPAQAASDAVDQSQQVATSANNLRSPMAQTFTAGASGQLDRVSLMVATAAGAVAATVQIQSVAGGKPSGIVLGTSTFAGTVNCCHQWHDFGFNPAVSVSPGTQYAIVMTSSPAITWYDSFSFDTYTAGQLWLLSGGQWIYQTSFGRDFCFQTWLASGTGANRPPVIAAASTSVSANEGAAAGNSGTYSDPDGDNVSLTASAGSLTKTGAASGTWTWATPSSDEAPAQTITITANDGKDGVTSVSFSFTVVPVTPTVTITGAPVSGPEGTAIVLTGKATSPSAADNAAGFTMAWNATKDGQPYAKGTGTTLAFTPDDEGAYSVTLQATDDGGNSATAAVTFTGTNVPPTAVIGGVTHATLVLVPLQTVTFTGGFTDPGTLDTHTGAINYGDGLTADTIAYGSGGSADLTETHAYSAPGTYTVTYTVTDDDGGSATATATVTVATPAGALGTIDAYVQSMASLNNGEKNGLSAKLRAAEASAARGNDNATCGQVDAFMNDLVASDE